MTICRWFQGELPVDRSILQLFTYRTLLARWDLERDTCNDIPNVSLSRTHGQDRRSEAHLEDRPGPRVQDPDPSVLGGDHQPAAISVEADGQQQRLRWIAVVDGPQNHPDRTSEHGTHL